MNSIKIDTAKRYTDLLKTVLKDSISSVFVFGSVARGEDTDKSDIDLMVIVDGLPSPDQMEKLGTTGRFDELKGHAEFHDISCVIVTGERYRTHLEMRMPREGINPLKEAMVLYDTGFIAGLKEQVESGSISLREDAYLDYTENG
ncbi:MAG: nucleotidyltransferase domain-containing protein [Candidatus Methanoperedens sp.]|nr:nucleotidyltransferase domain-containing protein [Candidatus Methanoperedens sp.]